MPPKRSGISDASSTSEPKKRMTRSSTRADEITTQNRGARSPKDARKDLQRTTKTTKSPIEDAELETKPSNTQSTPNSAVALPIMKTTTFTHSCIKKPIECHEYTPNMSKAALPMASPPMLIFTHGAGGTLSSPVVENFCNGFSTTHPVFAFQGSINLKVRTKGFHACIEELDTRARGKKTRGEDERSEDIEGKRWLLGGRSMGARAAVIATSEYIEQRRSEGATERPSFQLILISYPLLGPKNELRDHILLDLSQGVDVLFVVGNKDTMCPLDLLGATRQRMKARSQLVIVEDADHGMHVKGALEREKVIGEETGRVAARWVDGKLEKKDEDATVIEEGTV